MYIIYKQCNSIRFRVQFRKHTHPGVFQKIWKIHMCMAFLSRLDWLATNTDVITSQSRHWQKYFAGAERNDGVENGIQRHRRLYFRLASRMHALIMANSIHIFQRLANHLSACRVRVSSLFKTPFTMRARKLEKTKIIFHWTARLQSRRHNWNVWLILRNLYFNLKKNLIVFERISTKHISYPYILWMYPGELLKSYFIV